MNIQMKGPLSQWPDESGPKSDLLPGEIGEEFKGESRNRQAPSRHPRSPRLAANRAAMRLRLEALRADVEALWPAILAATCNDAASRFLINRYAPLDEQNRLERIAKRLAKDLAKRPATPEQALAHLLRNVLQA
jgi:hypothetical protein